MKPNAKQSLEFWSLLKPLASVVCSAVIFLPAIAYAQSKSDEPKAAAGQFEEVVVTARRTEENLQEVPISVSAFSGDYLRENNITELTDIAAHVPSMTIEVAGSSTNAPVIALRGQRPSESLITIDPAVPLYFADVALTPTQGTNISLYDLSNVQVLKGPQGMLFGRSSTGGAVLFTPTPPSDKFGGYIEVLAGDYNLRGIEAAVDVPVSDWLQMRFAGLKSDRDGYQENVANNALNGQKFWDDHSEGLRWSINFEPTDTLRNLLVLDWSANNIRSRVPTPLAFNGTGDCSFCTAINEQLNTTRVINGIIYPWENQLNDAIARQRNRSWQEVETDYDAKENVTNEIVSNTTTFDLTEKMAIKNILAYRRLDHKYDMDTDGTALAGFGSRTNGRAVGDLFAVTYSGEYPRSTADSEQFSEEIQLSFKGFDDRLQMVVGGYYFEMDASENKAIQIVSEVGMWRDSPKGDAENKSAAIFSEGTFDITPELALTLGLRYTEDERIMTAKSTGYTGAGDQICLIEMPGGNGAVYPIDQCARTVSGDFSATTWRSIATYKPEKGMMYYASISTGYRPGGFNLRATEDFQFNPFDQEEVLNYEIGSKVDWFFDSGMVARFNAALFWQDYTDIQKTQGDSRSSTGFGTSTVNAAGAVVRGADLELSLIPVEGLTLSVNYSYLDAYYTEWEAANPVTGVMQDQSDFDFMNIPRYSGNASISYLLPLDRALGDITLRFTESFTSSITRFEDVEGSFNYPGIDNGPLNDARVDEAYHVLDFRIDWASVLLTSFDAAVWIKNIENQNYNTGGLTLADSLGIMAATYGPPRTVGASLRYKF